MGATKINSPKTKSPKSPIQSPFSRKLKEKEISLLDGSPDFELEIKPSELKTPDHRHHPKLHHLHISTSMDPAIESSESEDLETPQVMNILNLRVHHIESNKKHGSHKRSFSDINLEEMNKKQQKEKMKEMKSIFSVWDKLNIGTPRRANAQTFGGKRKRVRAQTDADNGPKSYNVKHFDHSMGKSMTMTSSNANIGNPEVLSIFKVWASHGFYSNQNVQNAQQLRDYNMKI